VSKAKAAGEPVTVELTADEVEVLRAVIYGAIGGANRGPRKHIESFAAKLPPWSGRQPYVATIEKLRRGSLAVVIREGQRDE